MQQRTRRIRRVIGKLAGLSWSRRFLLVEAACWLAVARLTLLLIPFRVVEPLLGRRMAESPQEDPGDPDIPDRIGWAVRVASAYTPWRTKCLAEAMACKAMLRRRGLASTLYLGTAKDAAAGLDAHAWLRCGSQILTGKTLLDQYTFIARFAEAPPL